MGLRIVALCYLALRVLFTAGLLRRKPHRGNTGARVSVIVAARNEALTLPRLIERLLSQTYRHYEVIVVDDRSTDATPILLKHYDARSERLRVLRIDHAPDQLSPKMNALARGVAAATGDLLLFTDADCEVPPTWIEGIVRCFDADVGAVVGFVGLRASNGSLLEHVQAFDYFTMMATAAGATPLGMPLGAAGANLAYRRAAYDHAGGFESMPPGSIADDMLLLQRVVDRTGWRVVFSDDPATFVYTAAEPTLQQLLNQRLRWMAGGQDVLMRNPALLATSGLIGTLNGILLGFPLFLRRRDLRRVLIEALLLRSVADALHFGVAAWRFHCMALLRYGPLWSLLQIPYTLLLPLWSLSRKWIWKA